MYCRSDDFDVVSGQLEYKLDRLAPGGNASQTVVVRPRKFGYFNFTAAEVSTVPVLVPVPTYLPT